MGKRKKPPPVRLATVDPDEIFCQAVWFDQSAMILGEVASRFIEHIRSTPEKDRFDQPIAYLALPPSLIPGLVNEALAIELYFKAILALEGKQGKPVATHCLDDLYKKISAPNQVIILTSYEATIDRKASQPTTGNDLVPILEEYGNSFGILRYAYEYQDLALRALIPVKVAARKAAMAIHPAWKEYLPLSLPAPTFQFR
jgi:hypothetical protein